jgi:hypothetical protein
MANVVNIEQLRAQSASLSALDTWGEQVIALNLALTDAARARDRMAEVAEALSLIEAEVSLAIDGGNAEQRKARLTLALAEHSSYQEARTAQREARLRLADAERRIELARHQCRLLREAVRLGAPIDD